MKFINLKARAVAHKPSKNATKHIHFIDFTLFYFTLHLDYLPHPLLFLL